MRPQPDEIAALYQGETAPRSPLLAALLTLAHPALGFLYVGKPRQAAAAALTLLALPAALLALCALTDLLPLLPAAALALGYALLTLACLLGVVSDARRAPRHYLLQPYNHPLAYALLGVALTLLPALTTSYLLTEVLYDVVTLDDDAMYPTALQGDTLLIDRRAWRRDEPPRGALVAVQTADRRGHPGPALVGRVIARGGDVVATSGPQLRVNQEPLPWQIFEGDADTPRPTTAPRYIEVNDGSRYLIAGNATPPPYPGEGATLTVTPQHLLVLGDNRANADAPLRRLGAIAQDRLLGQPRYVLWSTSTTPSDDGGASSAAPRVRWERIGLQLR